MLASEAKELADSGTTQLHPYIQKCYDEILDQIKRRATLGFHSLDFETASNLPICREVAILLRKLGYGVFSVHADHGKLTISWDSK